MSFAMKSGRLVPHKTQAVYIAALAMRKLEPVSPKDIFMLANFGAKPSVQATTLRRAIENGWFLSLPGDLVGLSTFAKDHLDKVDLQNAPLGPIVPARTNINHGKPLSAKYRLNLRGPRADAMDNSLKAMPSHYAKAMP